MPSQFQCAPTRCVCVNKLGGGGRVFYRVARPDRRVLFWVSVGKEPHQRGMESRVWCRKPVAATTRAGMQGVEEVCSTGPMSFRSHEDAGRADNSWVRLMSAAEGSAYKNVGVTRWWSFTSAKLIFLAWAFISRAFTRHWKSESGEKVLGFSNWKTRVSPSIELTHPMMSGLGVICVLVHVFEVIYIRPLW